MKAPTSLTSLPRPGMGIVREAVLSIARVSLALLLSGCAANIESMSAPASNPPGGLPSGNWVLTFDEEFNSSQLDTGVWTADNDYLCGPAQGCLGTRWAANVEESQGSLHLVTRSEERVPGYPWTTGGITTREFTQQYGYFAARLRYGGASGLNNAFWLTTAAGDPGTPFEIDIDEGHYSGNLNLALHNTSKGTQVSSQYSALEDLSKGFHTYGLQWDKDTLTWYFDGVQVWQTPNTVANGKVHVKLSTMVMPWAGTPSASLEGTSMDVDWVHVYQKAD